MVLVKLRAARHEKWVRQVVSSSIATGSPPTKVAVPHDAIDCGLLMRLSDGSLSRVPTYCVFGHRDQVSDTLSSRAAMD